MPKRNVLILGAAGRDFHNFNTFFRGNKDYNVLAFTAAQIPGIANRKYPKELAGKGYPNGIPIYPEERMAELIKKLNINVVVISYSDLPHTEVMHKASIANAAGADFWLLGPEKTELRSKKPVISVCAVRTGAGKSPTTRHVIDLLHRLRSGLQIVVVRHPMPYGDLAKQAVQRFASMEDMKKAKCTIEEMEEYAPHIERGTIVYAGVDYEKILRAAEKEADIIIWDGGNNDLPFFKPDLQIVIADALRPGHEMSYYPGETNLRAADVVIINKIGEASPSSVDMIMNNINMANPRAQVIKADLTVSLENGTDLKGKRVLVIEDGPTITHGGLSTGAGMVAAERGGAYVVNPRQHAVGSLQKVYSNFPHIGAVLPAMGYSTEQVKELEETINQSPADAVVIGTPVDLRRFLKLNKPAVRVIYELKELTRPGLEEILREFLRKGGK
ncbi:MAG: cyclic 2,3-diphosphoglycerate synthase [Candidatus Aenigmatarchaeota archaeon]